MTKPNLILILFLSLSVFRLHAQWTKISVLSFSGTSGTDTAKSCSDLKGFGSSLYAATSKGLLVSSDNGLTWTNLTKANSVTIGNDDTKCISMINDGTNNLLMMGTTTKIYSSSNNGTNWVEKYTGIKAGTSVTGIVQKGTKLIAVTQTTTGGGGIYISNNYGTTWDSSNTGLSYKRVNCILVDGNNIFIGNGDGVYISTDDGASWTLKNSGLPANPFIFKIAKAGSTLLAGSASGAGVYKSSDNGITWDTSRTGIPSGFCQVFSILNVNGTVYFTQSGASAIKPVYYSNNAGNSWIPDTLGLLPASYFSTIGVNAAATKLFIFRGGNSGELYSKNLGTTGINSQGSNQKLVIYPNPAGSILNFETEGLINNPVKIKIFDLSGKKLLQFDNQKSIDVSNLIPGSYILMVSDHDKMFRQVFIKE